MLVGELTVNDRTRHLWKRFGSETIGVINRGAIMVVLDEPRNIGLNIQMIYVLTHIGDGYVFGDS